MTRPRPTPAFDLAADASASRRRADGSPALSLPTRYLTPEDIAALFEVPLETIYQWRRKRTGPPGFRVGRHLRYDPTEVAQWVAKQNREVA
ncbi:helix-turn-helix protein [Streptomyces sp. TLI_235]|nr:helix-turn-helix domain-containing protein [Streptomyces sp. TLI_235]PBC76152.1 helix-turn-helix protein [Streptomyces sp. TLI_235]